MESTAAARRRRLVEKGSDRLAFITGQSRSLPSNQQEEESGDHQHEHEPAANPTTTAALLGSNDTCATEPSKQESIEAVVDQERASVKGDQFIEPKESREVLGRDPIDEILKEEHKDETAGDMGQHPKESNEDPDIQLRRGVLNHGFKDKVLTQETSYGAAATVRPSRRETTVAASSMPLSQSDQGARAARPVAALKKHLDFTPNKISHSIASSENIRVLSAITIAILAVLSSRLFGMGILSLRPLFLLMLTNITIVFGSLMTEKDTHGKETANVKARNTTPGSADSIGEMLEIAFLVQKALGALFMDCSICAVIMICFLGI